jgi:hypothetical protein
MGILDLAFAGINHKTERRRAATIAVLHHRARGSSNVQRPSETTSTVSPFTAMAL